MTGPKPLLFACSGCSYAGGLADRLARELDRRGIVEMSCLAGIGARRAVFLKKLQSREVWTIDGCPIECARGVLAAAGRQPDLHVPLRELGIPKHFPSAEGEDMFSLVGQVCVRAVAREDRAPTAETIPA